MQATGANQQMITSQGVNTHRVIIFGVGLSNGLVALSGGALALNLLLIVGLILLIAVNGLGTFWQKRVVELTLSDGTHLLGEIHDLGHRRNIPVDLCLPVVGLGFALVHDPLRDLPEHGLLRYQQVIAIYGLVLGR